MAGGVFGAQLTIGNTSFHKLFSVSRDPYNIMRASGLRILADAGEGWQLLAVPSAFEMGLSDCRWLYGLEGDTVISVRAIAAGASISIACSACRSGSADTGAPLSARCRANPSSRKCCVISPRGSAPLAATARVEPTKRSAERQVLGVPPAHFRP